MLGNSYWNQAKRKGKITVVLTGPMGHNGPNSYLDAQQTLPNGVSFLEATVQHIRTIVLEGAFWVREGEKSVLYPEHILSDA